MEVLLNLVWALLTASLFVWWALAARRTTCLWRLLTGLLSVLCVALLLFPVISMTDDLNPSMAYAEDANAVKRMARSAAPAHQQVTPNALSAIASASLQVPLPRVLGSLDPEHSNLSMPAPRPSCLSDRSPPLPTA